MESLFIDSTLFFEKSAGTEIPLPEDPNQWPQEIMQQVYKQIPFIADFTPNVVMNRTDAEQGYGLGHVELSSKTELQADASPQQLDKAGVKKVGIPIIVREGKLLPLDILIASNLKMYPVTEPRLRQAMFRPQAFDITSKTPGDISLINRLYAPQRVGSSGAGFGMGMIRPVEKMGSCGLPHGSADEAPKKKKKEKESCRDGIKMGSVLRAILPTISTSDYQAFFDKLASDEALRAAYVENGPATQEALDTLSRFTPAVKIAGVAGYLFQKRPSVVQIVKEAENYTVKSGNHNYWEPLSQIVDRGQIVRQFGEKIALDVDLTGATTITDGRGVAEEEQPEADRPELIKDFGTYKVQDKEGKHLVGLVFPNLLDLDGTPLPISLFTNGSQSALQGEIVGVRSGEGTSVPEGKPAGKGMFYKVLANGKAQGMMPVNIQGGVDMPGVENKAYVAETLHGESLKIKLVPIIQKIVRAEDSVAIPSDWKWLPLGDSEEVVLVDDPISFNKTAEAQRSLASVVVRCGGADAFSLEGPALDKVASEDRSFVSMNDALFLLGALGTNLEYGAQKIAESFYNKEPVPIRVRRYIKTAEDVRKEAANKAKESLSEIPNLKAYLWKEAAVIPDPTAVDTVLSLGFLSAENITTFLGYLPTLEGAQNKLCELLIAARLGMKDVSEDALDKAIKSLEKVIEGLKTLAFQKD